MAMVWSTKRGLSCSWKLHYRISGKRREIAIGSLKDYSLADARTKASELRQMVAEGVDPVNARKEYMATKAEALKKK